MFQKFKKRLGIVEKNDRWCLEWWNGFLINLLKVLAVAAALAIIAFLCSCTTTPPTPPVKYTAEWVEFYGKSVNGIIGRTADGKTLVEPGYIVWSETTAIQLEEALAKLEQERISKLKSTMGSAP